MSICSYSISIKPIHSLDGGAHADSNDLWQSFSVPQNFRLTTVVHSPFKFVVRRFYASSCTGSN